MAKQKQNPKQNFSEISYVLGIVSIVLAFFQPLAGLILGVIGFTLSKKQKTELSKKAKTLNLIGIIVGIVLFVALMVISYYLNLGGINLYNFPSA